MLRRLGACAMSWGFSAPIDIHEVAVEIGASYANIELGGGVLWGGLRQWVRWMLKLVQGSPHWGWETSWALPWRWGLIYAPCYS
jgi:hypothetical protein